MFLDLFVRLFLCTKLSVEIRDSAYSETAIDHNFRLKITHSQQNIISFLDIIFLLDAILVQFVYVFL